jgi:serine/threonine protein kinase
MQLEKLKNKFSGNNKNDKNKYRKAKKKVLLQIVNDLSSILKIEEIYDDLQYLNYTEEELLECTFKIADLGTIHSLADMKEENRYPCIQTRYYRAPEVIIRVPYNNHVDYWSMATMYYELSEGTLMFNPHHTKKLTTDQVHLYEMIQWIGPLDISKIKKPYLSNITKKFIDDNNKLKYTHDYVKKEINPDAWHPEVLAFFYDCMKWQI